MVEVYRLVPTIRNVAARLTGLLLQLQSNRERIQY